MLKVYIDDRVLIQLNSLFGILIWSFFIRNKQVWYCKQFVSTLLLLIGELVKLKAEGRSEDFETV